MAAYSRPAPCRPKQSLRPFVPAQHKAQRVGVFLFSDTRKSASCRIASRPAPNRATSAVAAAAVARGKTSPTLSWFRVVLSVVSCQRLAWSASSPMAPATVHLTTGNGTLKNELTPEQPDQGTSHPCRLATPALPAVREFPLLGVRDRAPEPGSIRNSGLFRRFRALIPGRASRLQARTSAGRASDRGTIPDNPAPQGTQNHHQSLAQAGS
jgi:hypothetical protein